MAPTIFANASELKPFVTRHGVSYHPLWQLVPVLEPLYTEYEKSFDGAPAFMFLYYKSWVAILITAIYLAFCYFGPKYMENRKPWNVKGYLAAWNLLLSIVSAIGAFRVGLHLLYLLSPWGGYTFRDTICRPPEQSYADNATGLWCVVFTVSKVLELMDTFFVVMRKRPLIFLHWYHHATVLLCSWFGHITFTPALYFVTVNFSIHAIMYFYFFIMAMGAKPKWFNPMWITVAQISQMFMGVYVISATTYYKFFTTEGCAVDKRMIIAIHLMYSTYLYLFLEFFVKRFIFKTPSKHTNNHKGLSEKAQ